MIGSWSTRDGRLAVVDRRGFISSNVLVGSLAGRPTYWHSSGRYRWDDVDHPLDLVERRSA